MLRHMATRVRRRAAGRHRSRNRSASPVTSTTRPSGSGTRAHVARRRSRTRPRTRRAVSAPSSPTSRTETSRCCRRRAPRSTTVSAVRRSGSQVNWRGSAPARAGAARRSRDRDALRVGEVGDVEERRLRRPRVIPVVVGVACPRPSSRSSPIGWRYSQKPGIFSLPSTRGRGRVGEVDGVERVGLPEGHHEREVVEPADRLDLLVDAEPVDAAELDQGAVALAEA